MQFCQTVPSFSDMHMHISKKDKNLMLKDVGMAVPKTAETRCRHGSVQAKHAIQRLHK